MEDMLRKHSYTRSRPYKGQVAEVLRENPVNPESLGEDPFNQSSEDCVEAIALTCWNCGVSGHRYQDCLSERNIFCYGCGLPNVYKPNCKACAKNSQANALKYQRKPSARLVNKQLTSMTE